MKHLEHLSIINIAGEDADEFLQGQMTQDTQSINDGLFHLTSFCNVQGRVISTALIHRSEDLFRLVLNIDLRDELSNHLQRYILRSKVNIQTSEELIFGIYQKDIKNSEEEYIGLSNDPERSVFISNNPPEDVDQTIPTNDWVECDINSMIPIISKESSLQYIPQMLN
jgi:Predicted aminomethyltransferase related to GcvT